MRTHCLVAVGLVLSCRSGRSPPSDDLTPPTVATLELTGKIFATGAEPHVSLTLVPDTGGAVNLLGNLRPELRRLSGATVRVRGTLSSNGRVNGVEVRNYNVLSIDGQIPLVGVLEKRGRGTRLVGSDTVWLTSAPPGLSSQQGAKVWVVGLRAGDSLQVQSYGTIVEAGSR